MKKLVSRGADQSVHQVSTEYQIQKDRLEVIFEVQAPQNYSWNVNENFSSQDPRRNWLLWQWDVVEVFVQQRNSESDHLASYMEYQLSPINQALVLDILEPRKRFYTPLSWDFHYHSTVSGNIWRAQLDLPLKVGGRDHVYGNFFSCLGKSPKREYFSLFEIRDNPLDFHAPERFEKL